MNAPSVWQQIVIALVGIASVPYVLALLVKIRLLPLTVYLLSVNIFTAWTAEHRTLCIVLLALCVLYPVGTVVLKIVQWRQEELEARAYLMSTARPLYQEPAYSTEQDW